MEPPDKDFVNHRTRTASRLPKGEKGLVVRLFEIALVLVCLDQILRGIINANYGIGCAAAVHRVADCIIRRVIPQPTEWENIRNQINAAFIFATCPVLSSTAETLSIELR